MATGSFENGTKVTVIRHLQGEAVKLALTNNSGGELVEGQEVTIDSAAAVDARLASEFPAGIVSVGGADGEKVVVTTVYKAVVYGTSAGAITAGAFVVPNGTVDADGRSQYAAGTVGQLSMGVALTAAAGAGEEVTIGLLDFPQTVA